MQPNHKQEEGKKEKNGSQRDLNAMKMSKHTLQESGVSK